MSLMSRVAASLEYRVKLARFGIVYLRSFDLNSVRIGRRRIQLNFPEREAAEQKWELGRILFEDCYRLAEFRKPVATVLDIGANTGCFAMAARYHFPAARIHCYEPNGDLEPSLSAHCLPVSAEYFNASVGAEAGRIDLQTTDGGSMHSVARESLDGRIAQVSFSEAVERLGRVDVLKLDCEGAEWDLFSKPEPWAKVTNITMEYHLWARPGSTADDVYAQLQRLGFGHIVIEPSTKGAWGFARASKNQ